MNIDQLSPELQELCYKYQREAGNHTKFTGSLGQGSVQDNFQWERTPEGRSFWESIHAGKDMTQDPLYPKKKDYIINDYNIY